MIRLLTIAAVLLVAAAAAPVTAQGGETYTLSGKDGGWLLKDLLEVLGSLPDCSVQFDPQAPQVCRKKIVFKGRVELGRDEFFDWIRGLLARNRLVLTPVGPARAHTWSVLDINATQVTDHLVYVPEAELGNWAHRDGAYIGTTVHLPNLRDTSPLRHTLAGMSSRPVGRVNDIGGSGTMVIVDFAPMVVTMVEISKAADRDAAKLSPEERAERDPRIRRYEKFLSSCRTGTAAKYFRDRIGALRPPPE